MLKQILAGTAAVAAMALVTPVMAQNLYYPDGNPAVMDIDVIVEQVAVLEVTDNHGEMIIDDTQDTYMGHPSSGSSVFSNAGGTLAELQLSTNFDVSNIRIDFPRTNGIRNFSSADYFGQAIGDDDGQTLGVFPGAGVLDGLNGSIINGGGGMRMHDGSNTALLVDNRQSSAPTAPAVPFGNGVHHIGVGVATNWDRTLTSEATFAAPQTYEIQLTATIVP